MIAWLAVDTDRIEEQVYDRIASFDGAFQHPSIPALLVPFDALGIESGMLRLVSAGAPLSAISTTDHR